MITFKNKPWQFGASRTAGPPRILLDVYCPATKQMAQPVTWAPSKLYEIVPSMMALEEVEAQSLIDALWQVGVRPSNGEGSTGKLAATENHLDDMRAMVAQLTDTPLPTRKVP